MAFASRRRFKEMLVCVLFAGTYFIVLHVGYNFMSKQILVPAQSAKVSVFKETVQTQVYQNEKQHTSIALSSEVRRGNTLFTMSTGNKHRNVQQQDNDSNHNNTIMKEQNGQDNLKFETHAVRNKSTATIQKRSTNLTNVFTEDFIPSGYETADVEGTVHICGISATKRTVNEVRIFIKSVLLHARRSDVFFHFIVFEGSEETLPLVFKEIRNPFVNIRYELIYVDLNKYVGAKMAKQNFRNTHVRSGIYGMAKCYVYDLLKNVDQCIVLDTDTIFAVDPAFLWSELKLQLRPPVLMAATWYEGDHWFNSGVMLQDFAAMREVDFEQLYSMKHCAKAKKNDSVLYNCYSDQALYNGVMKDHHELFSTFTVSWNLGNCFGFKKFPFNASFIDGKSGLFFGLAHFTCLPEKYENAFVAFKTIVRKGVWTGLTGYIENLIEMDYNNLDGTGQVDGESKVLTLPSP